MELRQLRYLVALAAEKNFTRAAGRAHVAQPALSRQIRRLEDELGVALVDRTSRRTALTPVGAELAANAQAILADVDAATDHARSAVRLQTGRIVLGVTLAPGAVDVPDLLRAYHALHPGVELAVEEDLSSRLVERVRKDEVDLAVVAATDESTRGLSTDILAVEPLMAVVPAGDPLAGEPDIRLEQLAGRPLVVGPAGASVRRMIERQATDAHLAMRFAFETNVNARMVELVADGLASTVLPSSDVPAGEAGVCAVPLAHPDLVHQVLLARRTRRRLSPSAASLARLFLERYPPLKVTS